MAMKFFKQERDWELVSMSQEPIRVSGVKPTFLNIDLRWNDPFTFFCDRNVYIYTYAENN